ncbi:MAG: hypothetical protein H6Q33_3868 [Deltaproteobacteria bacterium]|jgi:hypothetical protein|nr:hypothetical protein [Deltaproteobacteria bacterium]
MHLAPSAATQASTGPSRFAFTRIPSLQLTERGADISASLRPHAYTVHELHTANGKKGKAWTRIGVPFQHKDGPGFNVEVHSFPLYGRIVLYATDSEARTDELAEGMPASSSARNPETASRGSHGSHANRRTR